MRRVAVFAAVALCAALYLADLSGMGMYGPDEPRYADIGRAMARSGDWITPRLWGKPWFEKPPLLYWMTAMGFKLGLNADFAPRVPAALLSLGFLSFFWFRLKDLWDTRIATLSTALLATTAGWLAYSHVAVTDIPVAVFFSSALLLSLSPKPHRTTAAALLGLAVLAKSLPPLVLFVPVLILDYRNLREWFRPGPVLAFLLVSLPWHLLCAARNGYEFARVLFVEQQLGRFSSAALQHVRPWWYYGPVFLVLLYPWFPLLALTPGVFREQRVRVMGAVIAFGFIFFSCSVNKLPGYLLPLVPASCVLMGVGLAKARKPAYSLIAPLALLSLLPVAARISPQALVNGLRSAQFSFPSLLLWMSLGAAAALLAIPLGANAFEACAAAAAMVWLWFQFLVFPAFDSVASARPIWASTHPACATVVDRKVLYGLYYYAGRQLPACAAPDPRVVDPRVVDPRVVDPRDVDPQNTAVYGNKDKIQ